MSISSIRINNRAASILQAGDVIAQRAYYGQSFVFGAFDPIILFDDGEQGAFYDPSDLSTLFQDDAGTTPVTEPGQTVGLMLDKSGNDNHVTQPTEESRPVYQAGGGLHWLEFDGVDDSLFSASSVTLLNKTINVFMGMQVTDVSRQARFLMHGNFGNAFWMGLNDVDDGLTWSVREGQPSIYPAAASIIPEDNAFVVSATGDINTYTAELEINNNGIISDTGGSADFSFGTDTLYVFRRHIGTEHVEGRLYNMVIVEGDVIGFREGIKKWIGQRTGVTL